MYDRTWISDADGVVLPSAGGIFDCCDHLLGRHLRPGINLQGLDTPRGIDLDVRSPDVYDEHPHDQAAAAVASPFSLHSRQSRSIKSSAASGPQVPAG